MSLFEDERFQWRETYFVLLNASHRPQGKEAANMLKKSGPAISVENVRVDSKGRFVAATVFSPDDYSAMDISFVGGEEVLEHVSQLLEEFDPASLTKEERTKLKILQAADARYDVYHFEQVSPDGPQEEPDDATLDPGALLILLEKLARLCQGVGVDPQSGSLL